MKKLIFPVLAVAMLFVGCSKEIDQQDEQRPATRTAALPSALEFSDATLEFASMDELQNAVSELSAMSDEQKDQLLADNGEFVSMVEASMMIVEQMREIGDKAGILEMRNAYTDLFIFDPNTTQVRVAPFYKNNNHGYEFVCNAYGDVKVAGSIVNLNKINTYAETWFGQAEQATLSLRGVEPRKARQYVLLKDNGSQKFTITTGTTTVVEDQYHYYAPTLTFKSESGYGVDIWYPNKDTYTVTYVETLTQNAFLYKFLGEYGKLLKAGDSFTKDTNGNYVNTMKIGITSHPSYLTGYNISTKYTGKAVNVMLETYSN